MRGLRRMRSSSRARWSNGMSRVPGSASARSRRREARFEWTSALSCSAATGVNRWPGAGAMGTVNESVRRPTPSMSDGRPQPSVPDTRGLGASLERALLDRVRGEYVEMPGLSVTAAQAARLWAVDGATCAALLEALVAEGFLKVSQRGTYVRVTPR